jgi:KaiC/GvpD/RAD55 family RecA-like ATPase
MQYSAGLWRAGNKMADLIIEKKNVTQLLRDRYKKLGSGTVTMITLPVEFHMEINSEALKILLNEMGYTCVYITLSKSSEELDTIFKKKGVSTDKLYYIDAISSMYGTQKKDTNRCTYTSGPLDVESISSSLRETLASLGSEKKCVFLDSVTTVLLYNSLPRTLRFSQFLTQTLKSMGVDGVMVSIAKGVATADLVKALSKLCDSVVDIA